MTEYHGQIQLALAGFYDVLTAEGKTFRTRALGRSILLITGMISRLLSSAR